MYRDTPREAAEKAVERTQLVQYVGQPSFLYVFGVLLQVPEGQSASESVHDIRRALEQLLEDRERQPGPPCRNVPVAGGTAPAEVK